MGTTEVRIQDAGAATGHLLEALLQSCADATSGGGMFAWTNSGGARAFLADDAFVDFVKSGAFDLVVGVDTITDEAAVHVLRERAATLPNLRVRAFLHEQPGLFHPKLAWFASKGKLTLIVGSGNLTSGGLKSNWEAFTVSRLSGAEALATHRRLGGWLDDWDASLVPVTDPRVLERAKKNAGNERSLKRVPRKAPPAKVAGNDEVLVAELPRGGGRWGQAGFDLANWEGFFGARVGERRRIFLHHVTPDGRTGEQESTPSVEVASRNYRFELGAARGLAYPAGGPPVGAFVRLPTGQFLYMLLMPGDSHYPKAAAFLDANWAGGGHSMRRVRSSTAALRAAWPDSPLWKAPLPKL